MISSTSSKAGTGGSSSKKGFSILSVENLISKSPPRHQTQTTVVADVSSTNQRLESSLVPYHPKEEEESCDDDKSDLDKGQQGFQQETTSDIQSSTRRDHDDLQENKQKEDDLEADLPQVVIKPQPPSHPPAPTEVPESSNVASIEQIFKDTSENEESRAQNADELEGDKVTEEVSTQKTEGKALDDKTEPEALVEPANPSTETILEGIETTTRLTDQEADTTVQAFSEVETSEPLVKPVETKANPLLEAEIVSPSIETMIPKACPIIETSDSEVAKPAEIVAPSVDETTTAKASHIFERSDSVVAKPSPNVETSEIQAPSVDEPLTTKASQVIETSDSVVVKPAKIEIEAPSIDETMTTNASSITSDTVVAKPVEIEAETMATKASSIIETSDTMVAKPVEIDEAMTTKASPILDTSDTSQAQSEVSSGVETSEPVLNPEEAEVISETTATEAGPLAETFDSAKTAAQSVVETMESSAETSDTVLKQAETAAQSTVETTTTKVIETSDPVVMQPVETEAQSVSPVIETSDDPVEQPAETSPVLEASNLVQSVVEATNTEAIEPSIKPVKTEVQVKTTEASESTVETTETSDKEEGPIETETDANIKASESLVDSTEKEEILGLETTETADETKIEEDVEAMTEESEEIIQAENEPSMVESEPLELVPKTIESVSEKIQSEVKTASMLDPKPIALETLVISPSSQVVTAVKTAMPLLTQPSEESESPEPVITSGTATASVKMTNTTEVSAGK